MNEKEILDTLTRIADAVEGINKSLEKERVKPTRSTPFTPKVSEADVAEIYAAYPTTDVRNNRRNLGKGTKSKELIRKRLAEGWTKQDIMDAIEMYTNGSGYLPNFNSFLNNLPCKEDEQPQENNQQPSIWQ